MADSPLPDKTLGKMAELVRGGIFEDELLLDLSNNPLTELRGCLNKFEAVLLKVDDGSLCLVSSTLVPLIDLSRVNPNPSMFYFPPIMLSSGLSS
jgi:hypothetical protein